MAPAARSQHFFTVRGRGFDDVQWENVTAAVGALVERAQTGGLKLDFEADATHFVVTPDEDAGSPLVVWHVGEPNVAKEVTTSGAYDAVVQTIFAAIKKIAPSLFEMTCPDGRDYRQVLARSTTPRKEATMQDFNRTLYRATIRVASTTRDPELKRALLSLLRDASCGEGVACGDAMACGDGIARHEEGDDVDVGTWLKEHGHGEAAAKWEEHEGEIGMKSAAFVVFPDVHAVARAQVVQFAVANPTSKTASGSTAHRVAAATKIAEKWIQDAVQSPGRVHKYLGVPKGQTIPMAKLDEAIQKVKDTGNKSLLAALLLAKRFKGKD